MKEGNVNGEKIENEREKKKERKKECFKLDKMCWLVEFLRTCSTFIIVTF